MKKFKTESQKLLDLMINSIYTNREIFLRELISNASDAVDKLYFASLTDSDIQLNRADLHILVSSDQDARTITVSDNGIGMTKEQLDKNLGTIAHSDSLEFKTENADAQGENVDIIGQFGVGFYSAFMVAKKVQVISRGYGEDEAWMWESDGVDGYDIKPAERSEHGTDVILTLKDNSDAEDYDEFLTDWGLRDLIKRYSNYVRYPIQMEVTKTREVLKPEIIDDEGDTADEPTAPATPQYEEYKELETINSMIPIWKRQKSEVTPEEYAEFYKTDFHDFADPLTTFTIKAEGALSYDALLFIPSRAPYDLYNKDYKKGLALYSSNVLIMEKCEELVPDYFNFLRGVVDSQDLQLNISRETLQHNSQLRAIAKRIEKKVTQELKKMLENDRESYETFWNNFGRGLEFGIYNSYGILKSELADLLLFWSAKQKKLVTFAEYIAAMEPDQKAIYYAVGVGDNTERLEKMPVVKAVMARGYDVLLCTQDVDEFCFQAMMTYGEGEEAKELRNVAGGDLDLATEDEKAAAEAVTKENADLFTAMKEALGDAVTDVAVSSRLTDEPAALTASGPVSLEMERILSQMPDAEGMPPIGAQRVLELNASHPVFAALKEAQESGDADKVKLYADILYNQALLMAGLPLEDPVAYANEVAKLMA